MSLFLCRNVAKSVKNVLHRSPLSATSNTNGHSLPSRFRNGLESLVISRSIGWYMCSFSQDSALHCASKGRSAPVKTVKLSKTCAWNTCCSVHTENDRSLLAFLEENIKKEKDNSLPVNSSIKDFTVQTNGSEVKLIKHIEDEMVTVTFNVNHTVDNDMAAEFGEAKDDDDTPMVSMPSFVVDVKKDDRVLSICCSFTQDYPEDPSKEVQYADMMTIDEVGVHHGDWKEEIYSVSTMDDELYDKFLLMLEDRGIDEQFVEQYVNFSTSYEHKRYIGFLENLKEFVRN
ncbi:complement component 1 Q subcomponent-binding protein, mitochondrial-like [Lineus longissimus]|uniref:complement component 1 Q subcomponent-binding protein, mitochondrial-like n=1 Tax=Lineus longissimus TaxID=88925 RepID=UPI002B4E5DFC